MSDCRICVVKIGGSLLTSEELPQRLRQWLAAEVAEHARTHYVLVVGGGRMADAVRDIDARHGLDQQAAHWICVGLLDVTARLVAAMLPELAVESDYDALLRRCREPGATIFPPRRFMEDIEPPRAGTRLPADWSVTSDSIAARLAVVLGAGELVLVKSSLPPPSIASDLGQLAAVDYVDSFLPRLAGEMPPLRFATLNQQRPG